MGRRAEINGEASYVNITLDGGTYTSSKLVEFVLSEKTYNINKTHEICKRERNR